MGPFPLSFPLSARCGQSYRAAGETAGVGWCPRSQAPVSEEGPSERVLHSHQRGESVSRVETAGLRTAQWLVSFSFCKFCEFLYVFLIFSTNFFLCWYSHWFCFCRVWCSFSCYSKSHLQHCLFQNLKFSSLIQKDQQSLCREIIWNESSGIAGCLQA